MRILQISSAETFGGGERHFTDLCRGLMEAGNEVFAAVRTGNEWENEIEFLPASNVFHLSLANSLDLLSARRLSKIIRDNKIDIVHAHAARDYPVASVAVRLSPPVKLVLSRHVIFPMKNLHKLVLKNVDRVIAVSEPTATHLRKVFPPEKIAVISNGINIEKNGNDAAGKEFRFEHNIPYDVPLIGIVGELGEVKRQKDFLLAAEIIKKELSDAMFVSTGMDRAIGQPYRRDLKRLEKILGLQGSVVWLDWVNDMSPFYSALDLLVSASSTESFGLAISEAMGSGTAVVATRTEGASELIEDGVTGRLVPIGEPVETAKAVLELFENPELRSSIGDNARVYVVSNLGLDRMVSSIIELYNEILEF